MKTAKHVLLLVIALLLAVVGTAQAQSTSKPKSKTDTAAKQTNADTKAGAATATGTEKRAGKLDINTASKEELEALPGIGPATSQKIIDGRPYRAKSDLVSRKIIGEKEYAKIKDQIIAHQVKGDTASKGAKKK